MAALSPCGLVDPPGFRLASSDDFFRRGSLDSEPFGVEGGLTAAFVVAEDTVGPGAVTDSATVGCLELTVGDSESELFGVTGDARSVLRADGTASELVGVVSRKVLCC